MIDSFKGDYSFLSNFYVTGVELDGSAYPTVEHAYQAAKTFDPAERERIRMAPSPAMARWIGRRLPSVRPDWDSVKVGVMHDLLRQKFSKDMDLFGRLLRTGDALLVEGNDWGDTFWGMVGGSGQNMLGVLLMTVRAELRARAQENVEYMYPK